MILEGYSAAYYKGVAAGLGNMIVTDTQGSVLDADEALAGWADKCEEIKRNRGFFFFCGNGASATIAEHMSHDCFQNADFLTATCSETSHITAISNDISYEDVFAYRIGKMLRAGDMLITISSSGNSPNVVKAISTAKRQGVFVVTLSGKKQDNRSRHMGDLNFYVPLETYGMVESAHAVLIHCWLDIYLDKYMGGRH